MTGGGKRRRRRRRITPRLLDALALGEGTAAKALSQHRRGAAGALGGLSAAASSRREISRAEPEVYALDLVSK